MTSAQGGTWDQVHLLASPSVNRHMLYVGQSRGRHPAHTWNVLPDPNDEAHGNVVADHRDADGAVLAAAARRPDDYFAAGTTPTCSTDSSEPSAPNTNTNTPSPPAHPTDPTTPSL